MDMIVRRAVLPDGKTADIGIAGERIIAVEPRLPALAATEIDAEGQLVTPPFVDAHFHLDATLTLGLPRPNRSGTLLEGIALWGELKPSLTIEAVRDRALRYIRLAVSQGILAIRTHVDICDSRLVAVEALLDVRRTVRSLDAIRSRPPRLFVVRRGKIVARTAAARSEVVGFGAVRRRSSFSWPRVPSCGRHGLPYAPHRAYLDLASILLWRRPSSAIRWSRCRSRSNERAARLAATSDRRLSSSFIFVTLCQAALR
jgi:cytosine/adenosine deaminase-related metal-dependent hydrolase